MRRCVIAIACVVATTAAAPPVAAARSGVEVRSTPPAGLRAGETWTADLRVHATPHELATSDPPTILLHNAAAGWTQIRATQVPGKRDAYTAAVVFPGSGTWTYHVHDPIAGGGYDFPPITVAATRASGGGAQLWWVTLVAPLAIAAALVVQRRRLLAGGRGDR
jgi:hypothetical protein